MESNKQKGSNYQMNEDEEDDLVGAVISLREQIDKETLLAEEIYESVHSKLQFRISGLIKPCIIEMIKQGLAIDINTLKGGDNG